MREKLRRYSKKIMVFVCSLMIFCGSIFSFSFESKASETEVMPTGLEFYLNYPEPSTSDTQGYIHVLLFNSDTRNYYVVTYFWSIMTSNDEAVPTSNQGMVTMTDTSFEFNIMAQPNGVDGVFYTLYHINARGEYRCVQATSSGKYKRDWDVIYQGDVQLLGWKAGGNAYVTAPHFTTDFTCFYSDDGSAALLMDILDYMHTINSQNILSSHDLWTQLSLILNEAESIDEQITNILDYLERYETKLDSFSDDFDYLKKRADRIVALQKDTNTWLEKIYDKICEALGLETEESTEKLPDEDVNSTIEAEQGLLQDTTDVENDLKFSIDSNSNNVVWNIIERVLNSNEKVFGSFIGIMVLGIVTLLLNR